MYALNSNIMDRIITCHTVMFPSIRNSLYFILIIFYTNVSYGAGPGYKESMKAGYIPQGVEIKIPWLRVVVDLGFHLPRGQR